MSEFFTVKGSMKEITRDLTRVQRKVVPAATVSALNKTAVTVRKSSTQDISRTKAITPQRLIRDRLRLVRASRRNLAALILARLTGVAAGKLGTPRQQAKGARVKRHFFPGAFVATMPSGYKGIFQRRGTKRLPIEEKVIPLQPEADKIIRKHVNTTGAAAWVKNFQRELKWRLDKRRV